MDDHTESINYICIATLNCTVWNNLLLQHKLRKIVYHLKCFVDDEGRAACERAAYFDKGENA